MRELKSRTLERARATWLAADPALKRRLAVTFSLLVGLNLLAWAALLIAGTRYSLLLGLAPLAYGLGLRHAVDPDHIAAIDNTTRKLMQEGQRPVGVGLFFSLGHSTVVFALSLAIAASAAAVQRYLPNLQSAGQIIGTSLSGGFLLLIAGLNLVVLADVYRTWRRVVRGGEYDEMSLNDYLSRRGLLARLFRPLLALVRHSRQMYLIGLLFGLGFDTASEVGILGMSAAAGARGMPVWLILLLPLLFVAGMSLVDTADGVAMLGAYGWAYVRPVRKLYYNLNITLISVLVALLIGGIEVLQVVSNETAARGGFWDSINSLSLNDLGFYIVGIFMAGWLISMVVYRLRGVDRLDEALAPTAPAAARERA